jgi:hypothetical protein
MPQVALLAPVPLGAFRPIPSSGYGSQKKYKKNLVPEGPILVIQP